MLQNYAKNTEYEILTPFGWEDFDGIFINENANKSSKKLIFEDNTFIIATDDHRFFKDGRETRTCDLMIGDRLDSRQNDKIIIDIENVILHHTYEIFNAKNHIIFANDISSHQCDEFSFVKPRIAEEFWTAMAPTLATGGKCIITSTPNSDEDKFAEIWFGANKTVDEWGNTVPNGLGINGFRAFRAYYSEIPGRDEVWAQRERAKIGADKFDREYGGEFITADETLINAVTLLKLQGVEPMFKTSEIRWYDDIKPNKSYVCALDPSAGVGKDYSAIEVFSLPDMKQVAEWCHNRTSIPNQVKTLQNIVNYLYNEQKKLSDHRGEPDIYFTVENNSWGEAALLTINEIGEENFNGQMLNEPRVRGMARPRKGLNTNGRTKSMACTKLKSLIESDKLKVYSKLLVRQLKFFVAKGDSFAAKQGENDDCVMATLMCIRMMQQLQNWDERIGDLLRDSWDDDSAHEDPMPMAVIIR
jgi:hypothetical protein